MNIFEMFNKPKQLTLIDALRDFLPIAIAHLELDHIPKIKLVKSLDDTTFGHFNSEEQVIYAVVANRNPVDILRTIAHEMTHYKQGQEHQLTNNSGETGSTVEDEANAEGGVIMRKFNEQFPQYLQSSSVQLAESENAITVKLDGVDIPGPFNDIDHAHAKARKLVSYQKGKVAEVCVNGKCIKKWQLNM